MSGGHFEYKDIELINDISEQLEKDDYPTKKLQNLLKSIGNILHSYDWFICGDISEHDFKKTYYKEIQYIKEILK